MKFVLLSIYEAGGGPDGQVWAISIPQVVLDGPECTSSLHIILGINVALVKFVLLSIYEAGGGPDGHVWAISGPHVVRDGPD